MGSGFGIGPLLLALVVIGFIAGVGLTLLAVALT